MKAICCSTVAAFAVLTCPLTAHAEGIRVDLSPPGRPDTGAPHFVDWQFKPASPSMSFGGVTVTLRKSGDAGAGLEAGVYKFGLDYNAHLACDGVSVKGGEAGGRMEMAVSGLSPGPHTITTYHNSLLPPDKRISKFNLFVNGVLTLSNVQPSIQVTNDYDAASAHVRVTVEAGKDVMLKFAPIGSATLDNVVLNGFEIDTP